ncbi:uncharacterized protein GGS22DRAFT_151235 [Annulohypoxylon maeteangense]|uniref:uncharacterized protein n=1 Tax=Annulohypoxylon maeteangense TaxID=1927788 RepID=UPI0020089D72|nr:uncharacterized protein GGS22DRAFT_151235 [Annulohypoxylon maeteangense]KAI0890564.1 hypothetical protein GGS22DRAFT_151235 [Annulohypoxylon maeteangense]
MGKKRDRWYERQIEASRQAKAEAGKPLSEKTTRSEATQVPFVERKGEKRRELTEEEKVERERARIWIREKEEEWEREWEREKMARERRREKGKMREGEREDGFGFRDFVRPDFVRMWEEKKMLEGLRAAEGKDERLGLSIRALVEAGKIEPPGPLDVMDRELLGRESDGLDELFASQVDRDDVEEGEVVEEVRKG